MSNARAKMLLLLCGGVSAVAQAQAAPDDLKPFPSAESGRQRIVIRVPEAPNPEDLRVEVMIGKTVMVDCNRYSFGGNLTREEAKGWGYSYYVLDALRGPASTMMACPPGTPKHEEFVRVPAQMLAALRYSAKVPIVVYVPQGVQVRYRIWNAAPETTSAVAE
jgi:ecotin